MIELHFNNVSKFFGETKAVDGVTLDVTDGEYLDSYYEEHRLDPAAVLNDTLEASGLGVDYPTA